jgi:hypothetical protein
VLLDAVFPILSRTCRSLAGAGGRPIPRQWLAKRAGTYTYVASTSTVTLTSGDKVGEKWTAGTPFLAFRGTALNICAITSGTPAHVIFCTAHGMTTGDGVVISNIDSYGAANPGTSCKGAVNGTWIATVVNSTEITLDNSVVASCTYGIAFTVDVGTVAGSPPNIFSGNANFPTFAPQPTYAIFTGFSTGWTSLNMTSPTAGPFFPMGSKVYEHFTATGATTTGAYSGGATYQMLTGTGQAFTTYPINVLADATHFTLSGGPGSDVSALFSGSDLVQVTGDPSVVRSASHSFTTTDVGASLRIVSGSGWTIGAFKITGLSGTDAVLASAAAPDSTTGGSWAIEPTWAVEPVAVLVRKKTTSADTISLQYAKVWTETSAGTPWGAAGGEICAPGLVAGIGGVLGSICNFGATPTWIPVDGSASQSFGQVPTQSLTEIGNGLVCIGGGNAVGSMAINPADLKRIYCSHHVATYLQLGFDRNIMVAEYEGDFTPRSSTETAASFLLRTRRMVQAD